MQTELLSELKQGLCGSLDHEWRGEVETQDGPLYVWIANGDEAGVLPEPYQIVLAEATIMDWQKLKRDAVAYVRDRVRTNPAEYGFEPGEVVEDGGPDWLTADLDAYLHDFRLRQLGVPAQAEGEGIVYLGFETHLDWEHGCGVEMVQG